MKYLFIVLSIAIALVRALDHHFDLHGVIIQDPESGLVLEGNKNGIRTANLTSSLTQVWYLEHTGTGSFYIVNKKNGKVLQKKTKGDLATTVKKLESCDRQEWFIEHDQFIVNGETGNVLSIRKHKNADEVTVQPKDSKSNQKFHIILV